MVTYETPGDSGSTQDIDERIAELEKIPVADRTREQVRELRFAKLDIRPADHSPSGRQARPAVTQIDATDSEHVTALGDKLLWPGPAIMGDGLPDELHFRTLLDWRKVTWDFADGRSGIYPDGVSAFGNSGSTWTGFAIRNGKAYQYGIIWYRNRAYVDVTFTRRKRQEHICIPLALFFPFEETLVPGTATRAHVQDHIDPGAEKVQHLEQMRYYDSVGGVNGKGPDWEPADGEYRVGYQMLWKAFKKAVGDQLLETEDDLVADAARADLIPDDGPGLTYRGLKEVWQLGDKQVARVATRLVINRLLRDEEVPTAHGGKPTKRFWRPASADGMSD